MSNKTIKKSSPIVSAAVTATKVMLRSNRNYLDNIILENFRGYLKETRINFGKKITLFFGKGSVGKSTIMEAVSCLAQSSVDNEDLTGIKTKHILSKKSSSKNFTLGVGVSRGNIKRVIKKKFEKDGSTFYPSFVELSSPTEDPQNKKNELFAVISNSRVPKNIEDIFDIKKFYGSDITFCENEYAFKELWEYTYKNTNKLIEYLNLCKNFSEKFAVIDSKIREERNKVIKNQKAAQIEGEIDSNKALEKAEKAMDVFLEEQASDYGYAFNFSPLKCIFPSKKNIEGYILFLKEGRSTYKKFLKYISDDIKKQKKFLYKNNRLYGRSELSIEGIKHHNRKAKMHIIHDWDTFAEFLSYALTTIICDPKETMAQKDTFQWGENQKILTTKGMFNACAEMFKSTLGKIKTVKHIEKLQMIANISGMHSLVEDGHALIEENQKAINKWLAEFDYDFKVSVERTGLSEETEIVHRKLGSKIPSSQGGSGVEYLLTFLSTCINSEKKILLLEEPEKALHSRMQVNLAKFFVENSKKNQLIIETHSENLLLGILKHVRDGKISPEDIKVNYVYMENGESKVDELDINKQGSFNTKWRDGFFTEKLDLI